MRDPKPEEMIEMLIQATEADYWNHYEKDFRKHCYDWLSEGEMDSRMSHEEYRNLPIVLAQHPHVELCTYIYKGKRVWGYYREKLRYGNLNLNKVGVVYDTEVNEIIHCMRFRRGKRYCEQFIDLVKIRW